LDGLPEEYDAFITSITSRLDPYTIEDIEALLFAQEERFEKHRSLENSLVQANVAYNNWTSTPTSTSVFRGHNVRGGRGFFQSHTNTKRYQSPRGPHPPWTDQSSSTAPARVQCQLCFKYGHTTLTCWTRSDIKGPSQISANATFFPSSSNPDHSEPSILGTPSTVQDPLWYPDTGATHHITHDPSVFSSTNTYTGNDFVQLGNGSGMPIHDFGSAFLSSSNSSHSFKLHNLLHVPSVNKNLISVSQFARDNGVFFEFFAGHCFVKNQVTREILLQGKIHDGLYVFPHLQQSMPPSVHMHPTVHTASTNTLLNNYDIWHQRLGHASSRVVHHIMRLQNITCNKHVAFCDACAKSKAHQLPFSRSLTSYNAPLQLVFVDIWGPSHTSSTNGSLYYIAFLDAFSQFTWFYLLHSKSEVTSVFLQFKLFAEKQTGFLSKLFKVIMQKNFLL